MKNKRSVYNGNLNHKTLLQIKSLLMNQSLVLVNIIPTICSFMNYDEGEGWHNPRIVPYGPFELDPAAMVLHYAQEIFEGMKAYRTADGSIQLFRPDKNMARMNVSCERLCIPKIDEEFAIKAIKTLVEVDKDWVPSLDGTSLYIRPYIFATDAHVGVHPAKHLTFAIFFHRSEHIIRKVSHLLKIFVEQKYVRAVIGGTGFTKSRR